MSTWVWLVVGVAVAFGVVFVLVSRGNAQVGEGKAADFAGRPRPTTDTTDRTGATTERAGTTIGREATSWFGMEST